MNRVSGWTSIVAQLCLFLSNQGRISGPTVETLKVLAQGTFLLRKVKILEVIGKFFC